MDQSKHCTLIKLITKGGLPGEIPAFQPTSEWGSGIMCIGIWTVRRLSPMRMRKTWATRSIMIVAYQSLILHN